MIVHVKKATEIRLDDLVQVSTAFFSGEALNLICMYPSRSMTTIRHHPTGEADRRNPQNMTRSIWTYEVFTHHSHRSFPC